jgi:hypothetical protein
MAEVCFLLSSSDRQADKEFLETRKSFELQNGEL